MRSQKIDDGDEAMLAKQVAYLVARERMGQAEVAHRLRLKNQTRVSRLLDHALSSGWVKRWELCLPEKEIREARQRCFPRHEELLKSLRETARERRGVELSELIVVHTPDGLSDEERLRSFAWGASDPVVDLFRKAAPGAAGVAWGRTISALAASCLPPSKPIESLQLVPICGDPLGLEKEAYSPNEVVHQFKDVFSCESLSLRGVPARIPKNRDSDSETIRRFLLDIRHYKPIFDGEKPLIGELSMVLTSVGDATSSSADDFLLETMKAENIASIDEIASLTVGNIGGVWVHADDVDAERKEQVDQMNRRWLGIQRRDFENCAKRGSDGLCPGVVVLATSSQKEGIVRAVMGMVNFLCIDRQLADALLKAYGIPE